MCVSVSACASALFGTVNAESVYLVAVCMMTRWRQSVVVWLKESSALYSPVSHSISLTPCERPWFL